MMDEENIGLAAGNDSGTIRLGFKPQKETVYNKLLPYADQIDKESLKMLTAVKANLGKAVMMREMRPGCGMWTAILSRYIKQYGLKFSKEDHLTFVRLLYELVTIPQLEPWLVSKFAGTLTILLKKKELLSPEELSLPWRPLYELIMRITSNSGSRLGMYRYFSSLETSLDSLIIAARPYFPVSATQEMLDEWRPKLCPFDHLAMTQAMELFERFLPIHLLPHQASLGHQLWLEEFMGLWEQCNNATPWEGDMMWVIARLAGNHVGHIDWEPYMPLMFTRFQRSLNLPVAYKQMAPTKTHKLETTPIALWIVAVLGGGSSAQKYLDKLMTAIETYFHPANFGRWLLKLKELLRKLPLYFVQRIHLERHKQLTWQLPVPESHRLTENDITAFVNSIKGVAFQAMFCKLGQVEVSQAMQHLATLRPALIIPHVLDKMYGNLETLTEPHRLTAAMQSVVAVARPMLGPAYPGGAAHAIPLLLAVLPGVDPNDLKKCFVTFQFISTFAAMVPIVDSSDAALHWPDLTEDELSICLATAELGDFVLQFLDRCFALIESSSLEATRLERDADKRSKLENMAEGALASTCTTLLMQTSPDIFKSALRKLHTFVTNRILETKVAGHFAATMCRCFAKVNSVETLRVLLPHLCDTIMTLTEADEVQKEEILDNELLYNLLLLSEIVDCRDSAVLAYMPRVMQVLDRTLHLASREGYTLSSRLVANLLASLSNVSPVEYRSVPQRLDTPTSQYLPIRDWGRPGDLSRLQLEWNVPGVQELGTVQAIIERYLIPELARIDQFSADAVALTREELQCSLSIITALLCCKTMLPIWDEQPITLLDSCLDILQFPISNRYGTVTMPGGGNVRKSVADAMDRLQAKLLRSQEDDTKSFFSLITIWECLMLNRVVSRTGFEMHWKSFHVVKKVLEDRVVGNKCHLRALLIDRAVLQHELLTEHSIERVTDTHRRILVNLFALSTSHYSQVRSRAQTKLFAAVDKFSYSYLLLVPHLLKNLQQNSNEFHESFKGSLYVLLGPKQHPLIVRHDWTVMTTLWPAIIRAEPSEKLSVIRLLESVVECVHKHFPTITISLQIPESCLSCAEQLWATSPRPSLPPLTAPEKSEGRGQLEATNANNHSQYLALLNAIMDAVDHANLHWRYVTMAMSFLRDLVHPDLIYPARIVRCFLHSLTSDSLELRKIGIKGVTFSLKQQKRPHKKVTIDPRGTAGPDDPKDPRPRPGNRPDNRWVQYDSSRRPVTAEEWDKPRYVHKAYHGYYCWPKQLQVYAPSSEQPSLDRGREDLSPAEREVDAFFSDPSNVTRLVEFLSLEEKKGKDKFNGFRFFMFKGLFRNHGDRYLPHFVGHLQRLVADKHESSQRCAAEIIAGVIRGSKHWPFEKVSAMWEIVGPLIKSALANMTVETMSDWGICFATSAESRDPNRQHWLLELLMEDPLRDDVSFIECGRLYTLQGAVNQQEWRLEEVFNRLLDFFRPFLTHPFQNVRERLSSVLVNIFEADVVIGGGSGTGAPRVADFVAEVVPRLAVLYEVGPKALGPQTNHVKAQGSAGEASTEMEVTTITQVMKDVKLKEDEEKDTAIRLLKTMCRWVVGSVGRTQYGARPDYYALLPVVCLIASYEGDEELSKTCGLMLAALSQVLTLPQHIPVALATLGDVSRSASWSARLTCLDFLQVFVFHNLANILSQTQFVDQVTEMVLRLLEDDWLDVREKASQVLGGLLHCDFLSGSDQLLARFKATARTKLPKKYGGGSRTAANATSIESVRLRHSGVLGLCAFINASPYDVPDYLPDVFLILGVHLNDPQPIPSTIRKTLGDFKRTHHDNWAQHSLKFTEDQLSVLSDLTIPPSHYA